MTGQAGPSPGSWPPALTLHPARPRARLTVSLPLSLAVQENLLPSFLLTLLVALTPLGSRSAFKDLSSRDLKPKKCLLEVGPPVLRPPGKGPLVLEDYPPH